MRLALLLAILGSVSLPGPLLGQPTAAARIDVVLATEPNLAPTARAEWYQLFTDLKVTNLRIRAVETADKPAITSAGSAAAPTYKVLGVVTRSGELLLPGGKFRATDKARLGQWMNTLRTEGPERAKGAARLPFGLTKEQLVQVHDDLARPLSFSTVGLTPADFVNRAADVLRFPLSSDAASAGLLAAGAPLDAELRGLSAGTSLAYVLDLLGLTITPRRDARGSLGYAVGPARDKGEHWPIGWPAREPRRELVPTLFDNVDVELKEVELTRVLVAVGEHVPVPILIDHVALTQEKINLAKIKMSLPAKRSMYDLVLRKVLVPNRVAHEVLVDEGGKPFLWITTPRRVAALEAKKKERSP